MWGGLAVAAVLVGACTGLPIESTDTTEPFVFEPLDIITDEPAEPTTTTASTTTTSTTTVGVMSTTARVTRPVGEVAVGIDEWPTSLNPYRHQDRPRGTWDPTISALWVPRVVVPDPVTMRLEPGVIESIPTVANGGVVVEGDALLVTWTIERDAVWSDGPPMMGADLAFTLEADQQPELFCAEGEFRPPDVLAEVVGVSGRSMTARVHDRSTAYLTLFDYVLPAHHLEGVDLCAERALAGDWPSGGPFAPTAGVSGRALRFEANSSFWRRDEAGNRLPYLNAVVLLAGSESGLPIEPFESGRVDVIQVPSEVLRFGELDIGEGIEIHTAPGTVWEYLSFNFGRTNPNDDSLNDHLEFRRGVARSLDRAALTAGLGWQPIVSWLDVFAPDLASSRWREDGRDLEAAVALIGEACGQAERDCISEPPVLRYATTGNADERPALATEFARQLAEVGVVVELDLQDSQAFFRTTLPEGAFDVGEWALASLPGAPGVLKALAFFDPEATPPDGENYGRLGTEDSTLAPEVADALRVLIERLRATPDLEMAERIIREIDDLIAEHVLIIPIAARGTTVAYRADRVEGVVLNPHTGITWNAERWRPSGG